MGPTKIKIKGTLAHVHTLRGQGYCVAWDRSVFSSLDPRCTKSVKPTLGLAVHHAGREAV